LDKFEVITPKYAGTGYFFQDEYIANLEGVLSELINAAKIYDIGMIINVLEVINGESLHKIPPKHEEKE